MERTSEVTRASARSQVIVELRQCRRKQVISAIYTASLGLLLVVGHGVKCQNVTTTTATSATTELDPLVSTAQSINASQSAAAKLKPVNFTLVDELFESTLADVELLARWRQMDAQFQEGIRSILKLVFPQIVAVSQDAKVSGDCSGGILKWILSLRNLRSWAIKMLDATGKPSAGIFEGSLTMFGNQRQCLAVRAPDEDEIEITDQFEEYFRGQFCVVHLRPWLAHKQPFYKLNSSVEPLLRHNYKYYEKTLYDELAEIAIAFNFIDIRMDLCVPSTCSRADIQRVAELLARKLEMRAKVMRCDIESREPGRTFDDALTLRWLAPLLGLASLTLLATLLVFIKSFACPRSTTTTTTRSAKLCQLVRCASLQAATSSLFSSSSCSARNKPWPLYGLRALFTLWFVIVQLTVELNYQFLRESLVLRNMMLAYWPFQIIINTSMISESLILITAFTFAYCNIHSDARQLGFQLIRKYLRLVPSIGLLVLLTIITPTIGLGSPVWTNFVERQSQVCKSTGHLDLLFLQNFISFDKICLPHSWLFCVELQLVVLTIPLALLLKQTFTRAQDSLIVSHDELAVDAAKQSAKHPIGFRLAFVQLLLKSSVGIVGVALILVGVVVNFALVHTNQLPPAWFHTFPDRDHKNLYFGRYLTKTWTHLTSFTVGLLAGYLTRASIEMVAATKGHDDDTQIVTKNKSTVQVVCLQSVALTCLAAVIFSTFSWSTSGELPSPLVSALYDSLARLVWSLALVALMVRLCIPNPTGQYCNLSALFTHPLTIVLGRLSFPAYLLAPYVHTLVLALQEQSLFPSLYLIFHVILGNIVITYTAALVLCLVIERPIRLVVDKLFCFHSNDQFEIQNNTTTSTMNCEQANISANGTTNTSATSLAS